MKKVYKQWLHVFKLCNFGQKVLMFFAWLELIYLHYFKINVKLINALLLLNGGLNMFLGQWGDFITAWPSY